MHPGSVLTNSSFRAKIVPLHLYHWHIVPLKLILLFQYIIQGIRGWWRRGGTNVLPHSLLPYISFNPLVLLGMRHQITD